MKGEIIEAFGMDRRDNGEWMNKERTVALLKDENELQDLDLFVHSATIEETEAGNDVELYKIVGDEGYVLDSYVQKKYLDRVGSLLYGDVGGQVLVSESEGAVRVVIPDSEYNVMIAPFVGV